MINIEQLTEAEAEALNREQQTAYWAIPIALTVSLLFITLLLNWLFDAPWSLFWWTSGGVFMLFFVTKLFVGKSNTLHGEEIKATRRAKVLQAAYKGNSPGPRRLNIGQYVEITLEAEPLPYDHPDLHVFEIYRSVGMPYYKQDTSLKYRYKQLIGKEVELEYLVQSGEVLAFRELEPIERPIYARDQVFISFGTIHLHRHYGPKESIRIDEVDYISLYSSNENKPNTDFSINIRSFDVNGISFKSEAAGFDKLFAWMVKLPDFDVHAYEHIKAQVGEEAETVWLRQPTPNAKILNTNQGFSMDKLQQGLLLEDRGLLLEWGTFGQLRLKKGVRIKTRKYPNSEYRGYTFSIADPLILGGLEVAVLIANAPAWPKDQKFNPEWPVTSFWADVSLAADGLADFRHLKQHLQASLGKPDRHSTLETDGDSMVWAYWSKDRVSIKISTWKSPQLSQFRQGCRLEINYEADISHFFRDEYSSTLTLHEDLHYLVFPGALKIPSFYIQDTNTRYTPDGFAKLFTEENQWVVWQDKKNGKVGIGNAEFMKIIESKRLDGLFLIGAYWRDKPADLMLYILDDQTGNHRREQKNFLGTLNTGVDDSQWHVITKQLEGFLNLPCQYVEDRQYY